MVNKTEGILIPEPGVEKPETFEVPVTVQPKVVPLFISDDKAKAELLVPEQIVCAKFELVIIGVCLKTKVKVAWLEPAQFPFTVTDIE